MNGLDGRKASHPDDDCHPVREGEDDDYDDAEGFTVDVGVVSTALVSSLVTDADVSALPTSPWRKALSGARGDDGCADGGADGARSARRARAVLRSLSMPPPGVICGLGMSVCAGSKGSDAPKTYDEWVAGPPGLISSTTPIEWAPASNEDDAERQQLEEDLWRAAEGEEDLSYEMEAAATAEPRVGDTTRRSADRSDAPSIANVPSGTLDDGAREVIEAVFDDRDGSRTTHGGGHAAAKITTSLDMRSATQHSSASAPPNARSDATGRLSWWGRCCRRPPPPSSMSGMETWPPFPSSAPPFCIHEIRAEAGVADAGSDYDKDSRDKDESNDDDDTGSAYAGSGDGAVEVSHISGKPMHRI